MACLHPLTLRNKFGQYFDVPCGKCIACAELRRKQWVFRMECESQFSDDTIFVTLTYNDDNLVFGSDFPTLVKKDLSSFNKKLKRKLKDFCSIRYYCAGEYGSKELRPHYHCIYFLKYKTYERNIKERLDYVSFTLSEVWDKGFVDLVPASFGALYYVAKYTAKGLSETPNGSEQPFSLVSRNPYLGSEYISRYCNYIRQNSNPRYKRFERDQPRDATTCLDTLGKGFPLPRTFYKRIFGDDKLSWYDWQKLLNMQSETRRERETKSMDKYFQKFPNASVHDFVDYVNSHILEYEELVKRLKDKYED